LLGFALLGCALFSAGFALLGCALYNHANTIRFIDVIVLCVYRDTVNVSGNRPSGEGQGKAKWGAS
jgi:hypothetical protein